MSWLSEYIKGTRSELRHVNWPTRRDTVIFTVVVIITSILAGAYLGLFDFIFNLILRAVILG
ncbi:MAG: preprotein translocase subunit SecE [Candidatus Vogelbacteria bacterium]|nr:preprotein translocase subunit SecE [Candidatus Vogelbacteria bacterium]